MEICSIQILKFKPKTFYRDQSLKRDIQHILEVLLESSSQIIQDKAKVDYTAEYKLTDFTLSPTVYEMIKRYEFIMLKREDDEMQSKNNEQSRMLDDQEEEVKREYSHKDTVWAFSSTKHNKNFTFTKVSQGSIPVLKDTIFEEMQQDFMQTGEKENLNAKFMRILRFQLHEQEQAEQFSMREIYRVFVAVTLRQIMTDMLKSIYQGPNIAQL